MYSNETITSFEDNFDREKSLPFRRIQPVVTALVGTIVNLGNYLIFKRFDNIYILPYNNGVVYRVNPKDSIERIDTEKN